MKMQKMCYHTLTSCHEKWLLFLSYVNNSGGMLMILIASISGDSCYAIHEIFYHLHPMLLCHPKAFLGFPHVHVFTLIQQGGAVTHLLKEYSIRKQASALCFDHPSISDLDDVRQKHNTLSFFVQNVVFWKKTYQFQEEINNN